jgi:hypothetical protein
MARKDYIPSSNGDFDDFQDNFVTKANIYMAGWDLSTDALTEWGTLTSSATSKKKRWVDAWAIVKTKSFTKSQEAEMIQARKEYESGHKEISTDTSLRLFITRYIRNNPKVTIPQKVEMRLTQPDEVITDTSPELSKSTEALLEGYVVNGGHLMHRSKVVATGQSGMGKGEGVAEIQVFIGFTEATEINPPAEKDFAYDGTVSRGYYKRTFQISQQGLKAWYYARVMYKGKVKTYGPPSEYWSAVVM